MIYKGWCAVNPQHNQSISDSQEEPSRHCDCKTETTSYLESNTILHETETE